MFARHSGADGVSRGSNQGCGRFFNRFYLVKTGRIKGPADIGCKAGSIHKGIPATSCKDIGNGLSVCVHGNFPTIIDASKRLLEYFGVKRFDFANCKAVPK